ncbi:site-specific integrase [Patescibacteria group bacterium]
MSTPTTTASPTPTAKTSPSLFQQYQSFLQADKNLSPSSIKNYLSDTNHFLTWLTTSLKQPNLTPSHITANNIKNYQQALTQTNPPISQSTINRRLSSLRRFGHFLHTTGLTKTNPTQTLNSITLKPTIIKIIKAYASFLKKQKLAPSTIKNYLSDTKQYLLWAQKNIKTTESNQDRRSLN